MGALLCLVAWLPIESADGGDWWSLRPVVRPALPSPSQAERQRTPIDAFLLNRLERAGLSYSAPADRATLIRRVTFDLHGLPPTYEDVQAFLSDTGPDAYERLVDRLLASPRYDERWGRHWLDVVRFAESNGFERDRIRLNFWPFRDYVIAAFNRDLPYDQFVREQLAGDAIRPGDPDALIATGFLVAGPKNDVETISALEKMITRQDELDEFVTTTGATFLGLTIGCARCHDHKFDPIRSSEYYALSAVFSGLDRGDNVIAPPDQRSRHEAAVRDAQQRIDVVKAQIKLLLDPVRSRILAERSAKTPAPPNGKLPMVAIDQNEDTFDPALARFVRLTVSATSSGNEPCIDELEVYGDDQRNLALGSAGAKAAASSLLPGYPIHHYRDGNVPDYLLRDRPGPETWRRSVYMFNIRTFQEPLMRAFDCPDPSVPTPRREQSTTALQALSLMNNAFVLTQADHLAHRIRSAGPFPDPTDEVVWAYRFTLSRDPSARQRAEAADFVRQHDLATLCRVLFNTNEFLYIR